ncbi:MAG TPA: NAD-dependent epimerase/dehydratase family protein [Acidobacteriota bacterium]|nr:NAD-dependent epimerase/dehydratase family protein [Acidobacteriota bacterium]
MHTILGATGTIGRELAQQLVKKGKPVRLVSRNPKVIPGVTELVNADITNSTQINEAVAGSTVVYLVVGLKYDAKIWQEQWPRIMRNTIEACKKTRAKLIFFDNVYMYGKVYGPMTEETPYRPVSRKGEIRAQIATMLLDEIRAGKITAMIARSADFYGPNVKNGIYNILIFEKFAKGEKGAWFANDSVRHSFTFTPDTSKSLIVLAESEQAWNQTWHLPTAPNPLRGKEYITLAANQFGVPPRYKVLGRMMVALAGMFNSDIRETYEMLYQYEMDYIFDSSKFASVFNCKPTGYTEGIKLTAGSYQT